MSTYLKRYRLVIFGAACLVILLVILRANHDNTPVTTATIEEGTITETVSVSGFVEADNLAELGFPQNGRVTGVYVKEGDKVEEGELLATIANNGLVEQRSAAAALLNKAIADRDELLNGQTNEERTVTERTVAQARANLEKTIAAEEAKVRQALTTWQSNDLTAYAVDEEESSPAPTVTGSYTCGDDGFYTLEAYGSGADSGYSARFSGLEKGAVTVTTDQPAPMGNCGLQLQFSDGYSYHRTTWRIDIPNTRSSTYLTRKTAYELTVEQAEQNIQAARDTLELAEANASLDSAAPRSEKLTAANASVAAAQADLAKIDAQLENYAIFAPFAGTITDVSLILGETATTEPVVTLLATDAFTLIARIPEIDITKIETGQSVTAKFDAKGSDIQKGIVSFISPVATEIDGVAYFKTDITIDPLPSWLRSGLNADIEITTKEVRNILRIPKRFVFYTAENKPFVYLWDNGSTVQTPVTIAAEGNNGYVAIEGVPKGTTVTVPENQ